MYHYQLLQLFILVLLISFNYQYSTLESPPLTIMNITATIQYYKHNQPELLYDINTSNIENTTRQHDEAIQLQQLDHTSHHKFHTAVDRQYR